ncbi:TPA: hypothetical protein N2D99_002107 [Clostridium botulinum]|nr:hypothetical protein [Clostridium botulinum]
MKYVIIIILILMFLIFIYNGLKAYTKINFGKTKEEMNIVNKYIYGSLIYITITTVFVIIMLYKFF